MPHVLPVLMRQQVRQPVASAVRGHIQPPEQAVAVHVLLANTVLPVPAVVQPALREPIRVREPQAVPAARRENIVLPVPQVVHLVQLELIQAQGLHLVLHAAATPILRPGLPGVKLAEAELWLTVHIPAVSMILARVVTRRQPVRRTKIRPVPRQPQPVRLAMPARPKS